MSKLRTPENRSFGKVLDRVWDYFSSHDRNKNHGRKGRSLRFDPLEERQLLSVTASASTIDIDTNGAAISLSNQSVATDDNGDAVVTWTQTDLVYDAAKHTTVLDENVYAEYLTHEVQQISLSSAIVSSSSSTGVSGKIALIYGDTVVSTLKFSATTPTGTSSSDNISGKFKLTYGSQATKQTTDEITFDEEDYASAAEDIQTALRALGGELSDVVVKATDSCTFTISYKVDALAYVSSTVELPVVGIDQTSVSYTSGYLPSASVTLKQTPILIGGYVNSLGDIVPLITVSALNPENTAKSIEDAFAQITDSTYVAPTDDQPAYDVNIVTTALDVSVTSVKTASDTKGLWTFNITFNGDAGLAVIPELQVAKMTTYSGAIISTSNATVDIVKQSSGAFRVNPTETDDEYTIGLDLTDQYDASVAMDADGNFVITWTNENDDGTTDIYAKLYTPVSYVDASSSRYASAMKVDNDGDSVIDTTVQCVREVAPELTKDMTMIDEYTILVNTITANSQMNASVAMNSEGDFVVSWSSGGQYSSYFNNIYVRAFTADGASVDKEYVVSASTAQRYDYSAVALSDDGYIAVSYVYYVSTQDATTLYVSVYNWNGIAIFVNSPSAGVLDSSIAFDSGNNIVVAWDESNGADDVTMPANVINTVYGIEYDINGNVLIPKYRVNSGSLDTANTADWPGYQYNPSIAIDADGDITVAYYGYGVDVSQQADPSIVAAYYEQQMALDENTDIAGYVSRSEMLSLIYNYSSGDVDSEINIVLAAAQQAGATDVQLGRIRDILDDVLDLLRGDSTAVMYTQVDASATAGQVDIIVSDATANTERDGSNQTLDIVLPSDVTGGSFTLRIYDPYDSDIYVDIEVKPVFNDSEQLVVDDTVKAINDAIEAAVTVLGTAWKETNRVDGIGTVYVRNITASEIAARAGTNWEVCDASGNAISATTSIVFEVTFIGSSHDIGIRVNVEKSAMKTTGTEVQKITFSSTGYGWVAVSMNGTTSNDFWYDSSNPDSTAAALAAAIQSVAKADAELSGDIRVEAIAGTDGTQYLVTFTGAYAGIDQALITQGVTAMSKSQVPTNVYAGAITAKTLINGGKSDSAPVQLVTVVKASMGTDQYDPSIAMQSNGSFIIAYTQADSSTGGYTSGISLHLRTFTETTDWAGPTVTAIEETDGTQVLDNGTVVIDTNTSTISSLVVDFSEDMYCIGNVDTQLAAMGLTRATATAGQINTCEILWEHSVLNPKNYDIYLNGSLLSTAVVGVSYGLNQAYAAGYTSIGTNKYQAILTFDTNLAVAGNQGLTKGEYTIVFKHYVETTSTTIGQTGLCSADQVPLGYTGYQTNGVDLSFSFMIGTATDADEPGAPDPGETDEAVNTTTAGTDNSPVVASCANGDYVVVWVRYGSGTDSGTQGTIVAQRYDSSGAALGEEFVVCSYTAGNQATPAIAMDDAGDFVITWSGVGKNNEEGIFARAYDSKGRVLGEQFRVSALTSQTQSDPSIAMDADGDFIITWTRYNNENNLYGVIYGRCYNTSAAATTSEFVISSITNQTNTHSDVAISDNGLIVVSWQIYSNSNSWDIHAIRLNMTGGKIGSEFCVNTYLVNEQSTTAVSMDTDGDFVIVWQSYGQDGGNYGIYARRYNSSGIAQSTSEFRVNQTTLDVQVDPDVAMDNSGNFSVVWTAFGTDDPVTKDYGIYARMYLADGTDYINKSTGVAPGEFRVNAITSGNQTNAAVTRNASNSDYVVVWVGPDASSTGIYSRRLDPPVSSTAITDKTAPAVSGVVATTTGSTTTLTWTASDASGIASATLTVDGIAISQIYGPYGTRYAASYAALINSLASGTHSYIISVMDASGNSIEYSGSFAIVASAGATISGVVTSVTGTSATISWSAADSAGISSAVLFIDGVAASKIYGPYGTKYNASYASVIDSLSAGVHSCIIQVTNASAITSTYSGTFAVAAPTSTGATIASIAASVTGTQATITWTASDASGISSANLLIDGVAASKIYGPYGTKYSASYAGIVGSLSSGNHSYTIQVTNASGITSTSTGTITVATAVGNTGPAISNIITPTSSSNVFTWTASDNDGVASTSLLVDGVAVSKVYGPYGTKYNANYAAVLGALSSGAHSYTIQATDSAGSALSSVSGDFTIGSVSVVPSSDTPTISNVVYTEYQGDGDGVIETGEQILATWSATDSNGISSTTATLGGAAAKAIYGPYGTNYSAIFSAQSAAGNLALAINATDGSSSKATGRYSATISVSNAASSSLFASYASSATSKTDWLVDIDDELVDAVAKA